MYRGGGSIGFVAMARTAFLVADDPDHPGDSTRGVLACIKSNVGPKPPSVEFRRVNQDGVLRVIVGGVSVHDADKLVGLRSSGGGGKVTKFEEACQFLESVLADGDLPEWEVMDRAKAKGIAERTLKRAKRELQIESVKSKFDGGWIWGLSNQQDGSLGGEKGAKKAKDAKVCVSGSAPSKDDENDFEDKE